MRCFLFYILVFYCCNLSAFQLGLENISPKLISQLRSRRVALVTNQTGVDQHGIRNVELLRQRGVPITYLCAPEHGLFGTVAAGKKVSDAKDPQTGITVLSLYKADAHRTIDPDLLNKIDIFIFDIQDAGMRHYTYISTLYKILEAAITHNKKVIVLDRPNLLGSVVEGPSVDESLHSFIGIAPIPVRHGLTIGELARYFNTYLLGSRAQLEVIPMVGYKRDMPLRTYWPGALSPNIASRESLYGYSFLGLLGEVGPFDVGVGTKNAFQIISLPHALQVKPEVWDQLKTILKRNNINSSWCYYTHPVKKKSYVGLKISIPTIAKVSTMNTLCSVLDFFKRQHVTFEFKTFDKAIGSAVVREYFQGTAPKIRLMSVSNDHLKTFVARARTIMLYEPAPQIVLFK